MVFAGPIVRVFSTDTETVSNGIFALRTVSAGFFFCAYGMVLVSSFNGAGDTWTPTWVNPSCFWSSRLGLYLLFAMSHPIAHLNATPHEP